MCQGDGLSNNRGDIHSTTLASETYSYDGNMKRVKSVSGNKISYFVYNAKGRLIYIDKKSDNLHTHEIYGPLGSLARISNNNDVTILHLDHLGSPVAGTSINGTVLWNERFTPFGLVATTLPKNYQLLEQA